jgi:hypothetical protein
METIVALRKPSPSQPFATVRPRIDDSILLPGDILRAAGLATETLLEVHVENGELRLIPASANAPEQRSNPFGDLYDYFAPVREDLLASGITDEELDAEIDAAIAEVRAEARSRSE